MSESLTITATELDVIWAHLALGSTPAVLRLPSPGRTHRERREIVARSWDGLRDRGLADGRAVAPEPARLLRLLARSVDRLELRGDRGDPVRAVAAGQPGDGVLAVRRADTVTVDACVSLPSAVLGVLPAAGPGSGFACTLPTAVLAAALDAPGAGLRAALIARAVPPADAGVIARMLTVGRGQAQIVAGGGGSEVVTVHDGPTGRYLVTRLTGDDGVEWTTVAPTDHRRLRHTVSGLLAPARIGAFSVPR